MYVCLYRSIETARFSLMATGLIVAYDGRVRRVLAAGG